MKLDFKFRVRHMNKQALVPFDNGYTASVIQGQFTYGGSEGLYEVAVLHGGHIVYDTPITSDVLGYLSESEVQKVLTQIAALPPRKEN